VDLFLFVVGCNLVGSTQRQHEVDDNSKLVTSCAV